MWSKLNYCLFFNLTRSWTKPISRNLQFTTITNWNDQQSNISNRPFMRIIIISWTQRLASLMNPVETIEHLDKNRNDSMACAIKSWRNNRFYTTLCFAGTAKFQMMTCRNGLCKQAEHVGFVLRVAGWSSSKAISLSFGSPEIPFAFHRSDFTKAATNRSSEITSDRGQENRFYVQQEIYNEPRHLSESHCTYE